MLPSPRATLGGTGRATSGGRPFLSSAMSNSTRTRLVTGPPLARQIIPWSIHLFLWHSFAMVSMMAVAMARDVNPLKSELITLSLNIQTVWYLDRLVETGLFGNNRTEAARVALYDHCKLLVAEGKVGMAPPMPSKLIAMTE